MNPNPHKLSARRSRLSWFFLLWAAGILALLAVALATRLLLRAAGLDTR